MGLLIVAEPAINAQPNHDDCENGGHDDEEDTADHKTAFGAFVSADLVFVVGLVVGRISTR